MSQKDGGRDGGWEVDGCVNVVKKNKKKQIKRGSHPLKHGRVSTHLAATFSAGLGTGGETRLDQTGNMPGAKVPTYLSIKYAQPQCGQGFNTSRRQNCKHFKLYSCQHSFRFPSYISSLCQPQPIREPTGNPSQTVPWYRASHSLITFVFALQSAPTEYAASTDSFILRRPGGGGPGSVNPCGRCSPRTSSHILTSS